MIFTESYEIEYVKIVMSFVALMEAHATKEITRVSLDGSHNYFAVVFKNKELPERQKVSDTTTKIEESIPVKENSVPAKAQTPNPLVEWNDKEKAVIVASESMSEAVSSYRSAFPDSKRSKSSIAAYYYFKHPKSERDKPKEASQNLSVAPVHFEVGNKVVFAEASKFPHPTGEVIELSSNKTGARRILIQFGINDKVWAVESNYKLAVL